MERVRVAHTAGSRQGERVAMGDIQQHYKTPLSAIRVSGRHSSTTLCLRIRRLSNLTDSFLDDISNNE